MVGEEGRRWSTDALSLGVLARVAGRLAIASDFPVPAPVTDWIGLEDRVDQWKGTEERERVWVCVFDKNKRIQTKTDVIWLIRLVRPWGGDFTDDGRRGERSE